MASGSGLGEIEENSESPEAGPVLEDKIFVAVGKEVKESKATLLWALRDARGKEVYILHVHQQAQTIPMPMGGKFPASKLTPREVRQYRQLEREKMQQTLDEYVLICAGERVQAKKLVIERDDIEKGIVELVIQHGITNLVMGAAADKHYSKKMREPKSKKAIYVAREAQLSCHISFVCKGILICTSGASLDGTRVWMTPASPISSPSTGSGPSIRLNTRSASLGQVGTPNRLKSSVLDLIRSKSEGVATGMGVDAISNLSPEETRALAMPVERSGDQCEGMSKSNSQGSMSSTWSTIEGGVGSSPSISMERDIDCEDGSLLPLVSELKEGGNFTSPLDEQEGHIDDQQVYEQLKQAMAEAEISRQAVEELIKRHKAATNKAILKAKASESLYADQMKKRKDVEELLARKMQELDKVKKQQEAALEELQRAREHQSVLEMQLANSHHSAKELQVKFSEAQELLKRLQRERDELQQERDEGIREAEELQQRNEEVSMSLNRLSDLSKFSFSEIEKATNGFDQSLKIGEGGFGKVYKGILHHTPVAIKVLHPQSQQGQSEFQQEVDVLSRIRHPNVVTLIGTCTEARSLVYEYLPNGSLEDRLVCKDNTSPLSWQTRTCIITDVCSALIFLHSNKPQVVVHRDLKPANILLDANYVSKLGDFGICRLISQNSMTSYGCITDPKGTLLYMDPEFLSTGVLTEKSDVYSFGIIILRLLTGKSALGIVKEVQLALEAENLHGILDELAGDWPFVQAKQLAHLGLWCCEKNGDSRPDLEAEVWRILEPMRASTGYLSSYQLLSKDPGQVPSYFICPIFMKIMRDPHVAADGFTYEAEAFRGWLADRHETSPITNDRLAHKELIPNRALKFAIQEWLHQQQ